MKIQINDIEIKNAYVTIDQNDETMDMYDQMGGTIIKQYHIKSFISATIKLFLRQELKYLLQQFEKMDKNESILMINPNSFTECITIKGGISSLTIEETFTENYKVCIQFDGFQMAIEEVEPIITEEDKEEIVKDVINNLKQNLTKQLAETIEKKIAEKPKLPLKRKISFE